jgi:hypothetical protein
MGEAVTLVLGLFSAFIFLAHAVDAYFTAKGRSVSGGAASCPATLSRATL